LSFQPHQGSLVLALELRFRHLLRIDMACELLAVVQRVLYLRTQRHADPRGRLGAFSPFRVADAMRVALGLEASDILLEGRGTVRSGRPSSSCATW
jgi:hypothetical protein